MKAAQMNNYGDVSVITINHVEKPKVSTGKVLVKVSAASLNPFDSKIRLGLMKDRMPLQLPTTLAGDIAGTVEEIGTGVNRLSVGDPVYGQAHAVAGNSGAIAEFAVTSANQLAQAPSNLDAKQSASLPLVAVSAWQALNQHIQLKTGQKLFINGGGGGIGAIAIEIAKSIGAHVAVTASGDDIELVKKLGADEVIDYKTDDFTQKLSEYDAVFDTVGNDAFNTSFSILKPGGVAVSMATAPDEELAKQHRVNALYQLTQVNTEALDAVRELVEKDVIHPRIGKVFPIEQTKEAFEARESGAVHGKVVISID